ncbi:hypothetical protein MHM_04350 [Candidatus Mycoplasma haemominutum 'Birmingham 1']|uniref:Uncharacterized protein n=1 Tax=Candidatus Mycoplasma haematominutum 'Birmingham 1' TaxID=1116213 RepID=G8C3Q5_9MOLU|nr:hypothetical protein MHM_04350 [Candidatus Mycoplasma haematominutum 'Birmingham 1']
MLRFKVKLCGFEDVVSYGTQKVLSNRGGVNGTTETLDVGKFSSNSPCRGEGGRLLFP